MKSKTKIENEKVTLEYTEAGSYSYQQVTNELSERLVRFFDDGAVELKEFL
ncbi:MAG: hypothetical protein ACI93R_001388 [Flavobacteriales bacterium]|jgi:hypothetical protein